jgi:hypothetical protein
MPERTWADRGATALLLVIVSSGACVVGVERGALCFAAWAALVTALFVAMLVHAVHEGVKEGRDGQSR